MEINSDILENMPINPMTYNILITLLASFAESHKRGN